MQEDIVLTMRGICKYFPGVKALENVDFTLRKGTIHALMGENGAGKSTLIKVLTGVYSMDSGEIRIDGVEDPILIRSPQTGRVRSWPLRTRDGRQASFEQKPRMAMSDPEAACHAAMQGLGVTLVSTVHALSFLQRGSLERVLPDWYVDTGGLSLYFSAQKLLPAKTRVFIDFIVERFREQRLAERFDANWQPEPGAEH